MKRLLWDTNIYGEWVFDADVNNCQSALFSLKNLFIFGVKIIRLELRATPKKIKVEGSNLRIDLLNLYDSLVKDRTINLNKEIESLAQNYYSTYREFGGSWGL